MVATSDSNAVLARLAAGRLRLLRRRPDRRYPRPSARIGLARGRADGMATAGSPDGATVGVRGSVRSARRTEPVRGLANE
jgi:hypothetical protein